MSVQPGFSHRWQKVRRVTGRIPLRIKLISAVLTLVFIALGTISVGGVILLRNYLLAPYNAALFSTEIQHQAAHFTEDCLVNPSVCPHPGNASIDWLPTHGPMQQVVIPAPQFTFMPSRADTIPGPAVQANPD